MLEHFVEDLGGGEPPGEPGRNRVDDRTIHAAQPAVRGGAVLCRITRWVGRRTCCSTA